MAAGRRAFPRARGWGERPGLDASATLLRRAGDCRPAVRASGQRGQVQLELRLALGLQEAVLPFPLRCAMRSRLQGARGL